MDVNLNDRKTFIGGSDAPRILGLWGSRYELWQEKVGLKEPDDLSSVERVQCGLLLEDSIARMYEIKTGEKPRRVTQRRQDPIYPWRVAQIDRTLTFGVILELKNVDAFQAGEWGPEGSNAIPAKYYAQVQHQLATVRGTLAKVAALIGGNHLQVYIIHRDEQFITDLTAAEELFWRHVCDKTPPAPMTVLEASMCWRTTASAPVQGTSIHQSLRDTGLTIQAEIKALEEKLNNVKLELQRALQDQGDELMYNGLPLVTWKSQSRASVDTKKLQADHPDIVAQYEHETPFRVFRFCGKKEARL